MLFAKFVEYLDRISGTRKRLEINQILSELFLESPTESGIHAFLLQGKLAPDYEGIELGVSDRTILKVVTALTGIKEEEIFKSYSRSGDLGETVKEYIGQGRQTSLFTEVLTTEELFNMMKKIAARSGSGSSAQKEAAIKNLFIRSDRNEAKYLTKIMIGNLRLGVSDATIISSLRLAFAPEMDQVDVEDMFNFHPDVSYVASQLMKSDGSHVSSPVPMIPMNVMLAERLPSLKGIIEKMGGTASMEYKYDGLRIQIHKCGGSLKTFSRGREETTSQFPEIIEAAKEIEAESIILDGEAVPVNLETGEIYPFQDVSRRRGRKYDMEQMKEEIPIVVYLFDIVYLNGEPVHRLPYNERRDLLERIIGDQDRLRIATRIVTDNDQEAERFFESSISSGCEGIVAKNVTDSSIYRAGSRGWLWIKFKRDYQSELDDTLDLAVIGAFYGHGRRKGHFGALLLASYDRDSDMFQSVCKLGSGFTDDNLAELRPMLSSYVVQEKPSNVESEMIPDVWIYPEKVIEVKGAEITVSPVHTCATKLTGGKGLAIRFPRFTGNWRNE
jgi:DNA ligase I, ATP-dependent (dnl1)